MTDSMGRNLAWFTLLPTAIHMLRFGNSILLARLLVPADFGIVGIAAVIIQVGSTLIDFGFSKGIVRIPEADKPHFSALLTVNIAIGVPLYLLVKYFSPSIESFYAIDYLQNALDAIACLLLFNALSATATAKLRRQLRFRTLAIIEAVKVLCSMAISLTLALKGYAFWSLICANIVSTAIVTLLYILSAGGPFRPSINLTPLRSMLSFSLWDFAGAQIGVLSSQADKLIIGKVLGANPLGLYDKAYGLAQMPQQQLATRIATVAFSALARHQDAPIERNRLYGNLVSTTASLLAPVFLGLAYIADDFVLVLLGSQWTDSIAPFRWLCISLLIGSVSGIVNAGNQAAGLAREQTLLSAALTALLLVALLAGASRGIIFVAILMVGRSALALIGSLWISRRWSTGGVRLALKSALPSVLIAGTMCGTLAMLTPIFEELPAYQRLLSMPIVGAAVYSGLYLSLPLKSHAALRKRAFSTIRLVTGRRTS
jgi:PST family polysaccharide transporter